VCGFSTIFRYKNNYYNSNIKKWLIASNAALKQRGPDSHGVWMSQDQSIGFSHRRLSIIDPRPISDQPMAISGEDLVIVFNGEIYNYKNLRSDLKKQGAKFVTNSDTEVILRLYQFEGINAFKKLRGMFAFAIWDDRRKGLLLVRDPLGIKPLYFSDDGNTIRAASQVKAIVASGGIDTSPEPAGHVGFFLWGYVPEPYTLYKGIQSLQPGTVLWKKKESNKKKIITFYNLADELRKSENRNVSATKNQVLEVLKYSLEESVKHHITSDVPVGVFLSSGMDSTSIASIAANCSSAPLRTITLGFKEYENTLYDETILAEHTAKQLNSNHQTHWIDRDEFLAELKNIFRSMDQPSIDGVNTYFISKVAKKAGLKAALSGLGGDELFGGYPSFTQIPRIVAFTSPFSAIGKGFRMISSPLLSKFTSPKYASLFEYGNSPGGAYLLRRGLFMPWEIPDILGFEMTNNGLAKLDPIVSLNKSVNGIRNDHLIVSALEWSFFMRSMLLRDVDWASMAHSLEVRVPLVDIKVIETLAPMLCSSMKPGKKSMVKVAWKEAPKQILNRKKSGFLFPIKEWVSETRDERGLRGWSKLVYREAPKIVQ
jgi:asparagine synthase (glutamine-hydrolysing)